MVFNLPPFRFWEIDYYNFDRVITKVVEGSLPRKMASSQQLSQSFAAAARHVQKEISSKLSEVRGLLKT